MVYAQAKVIEALRAFERGEIVVVMDDDGRENEGDLTILAEKITPDIRRQAKAINFGIIYGISQYGLAKQLDIPNEEAAGYIKAYFARFPELADYMERKKEEARQNGYVETLLGRKCYVNGIQDKNGAIRNFAERAAINAPLQGTAADIIKKAMAKLPKEIQAHNLAAKMLLQVHDELVYEIKDKKVEEISKEIKKIMESVIDPKDIYGIELLVDVSVGDNWGEMKKI